MEKWAHGVWGILGHRIAAAARWQMTVGSSTSSRSSRRSARACIVGDVFSEVFLVASLPSESRTLHAFTRTLSRLAH